VSERSGLGERADLGVGHPDPEGWRESLAGEALGERLHELEREGDEEIASLRAILDDASLAGEARRDVLSTRLMDVFRRQRSRAAFGLLYELNRDHLLLQVAGRLRRYQSKADANDVLQEVFVNIYRYPDRFDSARGDAFRLWTATIVRNTVLKHLRSLSRSGRVEVAFEDLPEPTEPRESEPLRGVIDAESKRECGRVYLTYLYLYLKFYSQLSAREQRAIRMVEVQGFSYRDAARDLGIKLENLKMVIFRGRRKIHRSMKRVFEGLPPDLRPAREPRGNERAPGPAAPATSACPGSVVVERGSILKEGSA
jgi:RNA polymerase sigma-70 factor (ECF subfamily)